MLAGCADQGVGTSKSSVVVTKTRALSQEEQKIIQDSVRGGLKDPDSAQFKMPPINEDGAPDIYCGQVNAKNSYGGYAGYVPFMSTVTRNGGKVTWSSTMLPDSSQFGGVVMQGMCSQKGYSL